MNFYCAVSARLATELAALVSTYPALVVVERLFRQDRLPDFETYCIVLSPPSVPWEERFISVRTVQYTVNVNIYLLVKVEPLGETPSLLGTTAGSLGLMQFISDVKDLLHVSDLNGLLDKSYQEVIGRVLFEEAAATGFNTSEYEHLHRALQPFAGRSKATQCL